MLEAALAAGRRRRRAATCCSAACCRRPAAPLLIGRYGFDLAAVISASHNPYRDNGIKFFGADGFKLVRRGRGGDRGGARRQPAGVPQHGIGRVRRAARDARGLPARAARALRRRSTSAGVDVAARLRQRRDLPGGARRSSAASARRSTVARRRARRAQHQRRLRLDARRRAGRSGASPAATTSASPSTATATACWPSTATARSSTATS